MLHSLWTRAWAWMSKRDRAQRFEIQLIFDEATTVRGELGAGNKIYAWATEQEVTSKAAEASRIPGVLRVNVVDRHSRGFQMVLNVFSAYEEEPRQHVSKIYVGAPETMHLTAARFLDEAPVALLRQAYGDVPTVSMLADYAVGSLPPRGQDITIRVIKSVDCERARYGVVRGNMYLATTGKWHKFPSGSAYSPSDTLFDNMLEVCRVLLGDEFAKLEQLTQLWVMELSESETAKNLQSTEDQQLRSDAKVQLP